MKKFIFLSLILQAIYADELNIVDFNKVNEVTLEQFSANLETDTVLAISEGTVLPLRVFLEGDLFCLQESSLLSVEVKKAIYVRNSKQGWLVSSDLKEWSSFTEFTKGNCSIGIGIENDERFIAVGAKVDQIVKDEEVNN